MALNDSLGDRMKMYEAVPKHVLMRRTPVIIRIDGKAFHTFTKGFAKPFDNVLIKTMQQTTKYLCEKIQGCVLGYTQSDEITLVICDYQTFNTSAWFDNEIQKICSVSASMATMAFNRLFSENVQSWYKDEADHNSTDEMRRYCRYQFAMESGAMFDSRCFNVPVEEVTNCVLWRQLDASRNSVEMLGRAYFSHKELDHKNCSMIQDMLHEKFDVNWNNLPTTCKRGSCVVKNDDGKWFIDNEIPIFKQDGRDYIEKRITFE